MTVHLSAGSEGDEGDSNHLGSPIPPAIVVDSPGATRARHTSSPTPRFTVNRITDQELVNDAADRTRKGSSPLEGLYRPSSDEFDSEEGPRKRCMSDAVVNKRKRRAKSPENTITETPVGNPAKSVASPGDPEELSVSVEEDAQEAPEPRQLSTRRKSSEVSLTGKVPQMYLSLLAPYDHQASIVSGLSLGQATVVSTIGDLPVFPNTFGADPQKFMNQRKLSYYSNYGMSRPPSYDGSLVYYDQGPIAPCNRSLAGDSYANYNPYDSNKHNGARRDGDNTFEVSWDKFQEAFWQLKGRMTKHGGFYNVASTYFLLTYSGHGFKHWFLPMGFVRKGFWIGLVLFFVYAMIVQSIQTVQNYMTYPKSVSVYVVDEDKADFPAVTVCNFNMLSKSRLTYQAQKARSTFPKRFEDVLHLEARFEKMLRKQKNGEMDYKAICTDGYLNWQSPSLKVAPVKQPWPYLEEEKQWDATVLELKKSRLKEIMPKEQLLSHVNSTGSESMIGKNPCQQMKHFGVEKGFSIKQAKVKQWEDDTGYQFISNQHALPAPNEVFQCSSDGMSLLGFNDTALAEICGKAFYDPTSNRPCLSSYFQSDGVPLNLVCFPLNRICDGSFDCGQQHDDTDEALYCDSNSGKPTCDKVENLNQCGNGNCYESSLQCDGFEDCSDGSDERDCQGLRFDKSCGCYVICENQDGGEEECYRLSPFDGIYDGNVEKVMWRSKTAGDFNDVTSLLAPTPDEIRKFGVRGQDFIVSCSFDGIPCSYKDFFKWQNEEFGNCFTFNSPLLANATGAEDNVYRTAKYGYRNGLRLTMNIEMDDYLSAVTPTQGARMLIHDRLEIPFPAENGIDLSPLVETAVVVKRKHIERVPSPHGKCDQRNEDIWERSFNASYSSLACALICKESLIRKKCGCSKSLNPVFHQKQLQLCSSSNRTQRTCVDETTQLFQQGDKTIRKEAGAGCENCAPSCNEWIFEPTTSGTIKNKMFQFIFSSVNKVFLTDDFCSGTETPIESGTVHAHVYLDTLSHEYIVESPAYSFQQFVSNVGGIWGLFAGFSIITFIEWIEITINFFMHMGKRALRRLKATDIDDHKVEEGDIDEREENGDLRQHNHEATENNTRY